MALTFTEETGMAAIKTNKLVVIDFGAFWCGPCKTMAPIVEQVAKKYIDKVIIGTINVDDAPAITKQFGVRNIPAILFFKDGELIDKSVGVVSRQTLEDKIENLFNYDS